MNYFHMHSTDKHFYWDQISLLRWNQVLFLKIKLFIIQCVKAINRHLPAGVLYLFSGKQKDFFLFPYQSWRFLQHKTIFQNDWLSSNRKESRSFRHKLAESGNYTGKCPNLHSQYWQSCNNFSSDTPQDFL